jgi:uncharacterized surface protein with fasciclin (FAS1) repeats
VTQLLSSAQNVTVLAPSNDAFTKLLARNPNAAQLMNNPTALTGVLQYHVLGGKIMSNQFSTTPKFAASMLSQGRQYGHDLWRVQAGLHGHHRSMPLNPPV